jgi:UDP-N-acetylmuramyl pentapeptide phosphotransferase/UDP-N-acetylglucosamine-1-phosphate transferase
MSLFFVIQVRYECMVVNSGITFIALAGWLYKMYMGLMAVFCTNSVNILAGVNGLEVGQTVIIACAVCSLNQLLYDWSCLSWLESLHQT